MNKKPFRKFFFKVLPYSLAIIFIITCITSISYKSRTRDEHRHLIRGTMLLETGDYRLNKHHPIFANVLNAIPVMFMEDMQLPSTNSDAWDNAEKDILSGELVEINGGSREFVPKILNPARTVTIIAIGISGIIFFFVTKKEWGEFVASVSTFLYLFSPNIIAHSRLVTTDVWIVPLIFFGTFSLYKYLRSPSRINLIIFVLLGFLSLITKYSAVPIAALWLLCIAIYRFQNAKLSVLKKLIFAISVPFVTVVIWIVFLWGAYGFRFETLASTNYGDIERTQSHLDNISGLTKNMTFLREPLQNLYTSIKLPFPEYIQGFYENVILHDVYGHDSFLYGMYAKTGWWYYFPLTILIKEPIPIILGTLGILGFTVYKFVKSKPQFERWRSYIRINPGYVLILTPVFFMLLSMKSSINLGMRHILPVLPFLYLGIGILTKQLWEKKLHFKIVISLFLVWYGISAFSIYPHYLEYFNEFIGGPKNGYKYLLDSNLSWGQNTFLVEDYVDSLPEETSVFINPTEEVQKGTIIIDVDLLMGRDEAKREKTAWLREPLLSGEIEPTDRIANTHLVFVIEDTQN